MNLVGFVPAVGAAKDVVVSGAYAYVASAEFGLAIADISDPENIVAVGAPKVPFYAERVAVSGNTAVLTGNSTGLFVVDVTTKTAPVLVGRIGGGTPSRPFKGVVMSGTKAYALEVVAGNPATVWLRVIDVATPATPTIVGSVQVASSSEVSHAGTHVYVAATLTGVQVVNVATPTAPAIVATLNTAGNAKDVHAAGDVLYVADDVAVRVCDITTPASISLTGSTAAIGATRITANGTTAYASNGLQLHIIDATTPATPTVSSTSTGYSGEMMSVVGTTLYLASPNGNATTQVGGLYTIDCSNPAAPVKLDNLYGGFDHFGVACSGNYAIVGGNVGLKVVDISTPALPAPVAHMTGVWRGGTGRSGNYGFSVLVTPGNPATQELISINMTTPSNPTIAGRISLAGFGKATLGAMSISGTKLAVAAGDVGVVVYDITNPASLALVGWIPLTGFVKDVAISGNTIYAAGTGAFYTIDITTMSQAGKTVGTLAIPSSVVAVGGSNRVYVLGGLPTQLRVVDVTNRRTPVLKSTSPSYGAQSLCAFGTTVVLATPALNHQDVNGGIRVINCANPAAPVLSQRIEVPGTTRIAFNVGTTVYAGDKAGIVSILS